MANTSSRTLRLLSLLQNHRYWPGQQLADRLEVSPRTLRRDIERLRALGYPVESNTGIAGGYQLSAGSTMPPLLLQNDEALALVVGLHAAAHAGLAGLADSSVTALTKLLQLLPAELRRQVDGLVASTVWPAPNGSDPEASPATLTAVAQACRDCVRIEFTYSSRDGAITERAVEPYRLVAQWRRWYLLAFDPAREDWRTFRADRISNARPLRNTFTPRPLPASDVGDYVRASISNAGRPHNVRIRVELDVETLRDRVGHWGTTVAVGQQQSELHLTTDSFAWVVMILDSLRAGFRILEPPALLEHVIATGTFLTGNAFAQ